jgi:hypothetical protein
MPRRRQRIYNEAWRDALHEAAHAVMAYLYHHPARPAGLCPEHRYRDPQMEQFAATDYRPEPGEVFAGSDRGPFKDAATVYAAGVWADLHWDVAEPPSGFEPNYSAFPDWFIAKRLIGRVTPRNQVGEFFDERMVIYRRASQCLAVPPHRAAVEALARAIPELGHLPADRVTATIPWAIDAAKWPSPTTTTPRDMTGSCPACCPQVGGTDVASCPVEGLGRPPMRKAIISRAASLARDEVNISDDLEVAA